MEAHPLANHYRLMNDDEFARHKADIAAHGCRMPIILFRGKILDGRNRFRACTELGVEFKYEEFVGTEAEASDAVDSWNLERRHLTLVDRDRRIAEKVAAGESCRAAGKQFGLHHTTVARIVQKQAQVLHDATPEAKLEDSTTESEPTPPAIAPKPIAPPPAQEVNGQDGKKYRVAPKAKPPKAPEPTPEPEPPPTPAGATSPRSAL